MIDTNEPTDDLVREMYARFGLAYYNSEVLHRALCLILAISGLPRRDLITRPRIEEKLAHAFSLTLGDVITELGEKLPAEYLSKLEEVREKRNFLAHHFWFDRAHLMFRADHVYRLIQELDGYTEVFSRLDEEASAWFHAQQTDLGLTDEILQDSLTHILSGQDKEPLPGKAIVKKIEKKLKQKQCLVRVWELELLNGGKPLVFELQDGSLWQLCDVGLGWTHFQHTESHWVENPDIQLYLPAEIMPRPHNAKTWEYEFELKHGAILWVKSGRRPQKFLWGIRTKSGGTEQAHADRRRLCPRG